MSGEDIGIAALRRAHRILSIRLCVLLARGVPETDEEYCQIRELLDKLPEYLDPERDQDRP